MKRREIIQTAGVCSILSISGCLSRDSPPDERRKERGERDVDLDKYAVVDEPDYILIQDDGIVENIAGGSEPETMSFDEWFEQWAFSECRNVAADAVLEYIHEKVGETDGIGARSVSDFNPRTDQEPEWELNVEYMWFGDDSSWISSYDKPPIEFDELVSVTPETVSATVELDGYGDTNTCSAPVYVQEIVITDD